MSEEQRQLYKILELIKYYDAEIATLKEYIHGLRYDEPT